VVSVKKGEEHGFFKEHVIFKVFFEDIQNNQSSAEETEVVQYCPKFVRKPLISPDLFCEVFPYHLIFDKDLVIQQWGASIQRRCLQEEDKKTALDDIFNLIYPAMPLTFTHILRFINAKFVLEVKAKVKGQNGHGKLVVKGRYILFIIMFTQCPF
jgi:hypothetical protein